MDTQLRKSIVDKMDKAVQALTNNFHKIRTGRAHPSIIEAVQVDYLGSKLPLNQLATINVENARSLLVSPWDKSSVASIEKAIRDSDLGLNPSSQSNNIRVPLPELNEETRKNYIKQARQGAEQARVTIRNIRRDATQQLRDTVSSEDDERRYEAELQKLTDQYIGDIDKLLKQKENDLMEV